MITRLLIANRGEISQRIIRTCSKAGVSTVAVFADPDADAPHVRCADRAVHLPGSAPADTYLRSDLLVAAAVKTGADAVHPGYGFLSENASFARAVLAAGLIWVGPPPEAIEAMGSKVTAKKLMADAGVPVLSDDSGRFPVLVKASAGGGGRGMRVVRAPSELATALESARREGESAFGDPTVFTEPYIETGRHIEVQLLADTHGTIWTLGERECSIQRRHQKVIEETPSPFVSPPLRARLFEAALNAARAIGYVGAGTVEFLVEPSGEFWFLEVNTRLQVEHPVTEAVYGLDLVALQLSIAEGGALGEMPAPHGHAIEARLYAEDPANGWRPQSGVLHRFDVPGDVRVDSGVVDGSIIGTHYDPMLAKVIAHAPTRDEAARKLASSLQRARIHGPTTNRDLLVRTLRHSEFLAGDIDTAFLTRHDLTASLASEDDERLAAVAAAAARTAARRAAATVQRTIPAGWRNNPPSPRPSPRNGLFALGSTNRADNTAIRVTVRDASADEVALERDGVLHRFAVHLVGDTAYVDGPSGAVTLTEPPRFPEPGQAAAPGSLLAPMPGTVVRVSVTAGQRVEKGRPLLILEAMKMEHPIAAPHNGTVTELNVQPGKQVDAGAVLAVITEDA